MAISAALLDDAQGMDRPELRGMHLFELTGRVAVVTGAGRGLGRAMAMALAAAGAGVVVSSRTTTEIDEVRDEIRGLGRRAEAIPVDCADEASCEALIAGTIERLGKIDILVNNAGINVRKPILELSAAEFDRVLQTNLYGYFYCARAAGKHMVPRGSGKIINISSMMGRVAAAEIDSHYLPAVEVVGEIGESLRALTAGCDFQAPVWLDGGARRAALQVLERHRSDTSFPFKPQRVLADLRTVLQDDDILIADVGVHKLWVATLFPAARANPAVCLMEGCYRTVRFVGQHSPPAVNGWRASKQLRPGSVDLCGVGLRVVPVAEHPGQFLPFQADHHRAVVGHAAGMVNLPRQKEGDVSWPLDPTLQGFQLWCGPVGCGVRPPPLGLLDGALVHPVDHPGGPVVVGQVVLAWALDAAHQQEPSLRMPKLLVLVEIVASKTALGRQRDPLLQPPGRTQ